MKKLGTPSNKLIVLTLMILVLTSCHKSPVEVNEMPPGAYPALAEASYDEVYLSSAGRKIIKEGEMRFECEDISATRKTIKEVIKKYKGYVSEEDERGYKGRIEHQLCIKVPAENFDDLIDEILSGAKDVDQKHVELSDITETFIDIEARLQVKKETETKYLDLLKRASKVEEILSIEKELSEIRADIESFERRLEHLQKQVTYSTLNVIFYQEVPVSIEFFRKVGEGLKAGWRNLFLVVIGLVNVWPFIILLILGYLIVQHYRKKRKQR